MATSTDIRLVLERHAEECRRALSEGIPRPKLDAETGAYLTRAYLTGADLTGANLTSANLMGFQIVKGSVAQWSSTYYAITAMSERGRFLAYGCEAHTLDEWDRRVGDLCRRHEPNKAARYEAEIRALIALSRTLDMEDSTDGE